MTNKEKYKLFCNEEKNIPIFLTYDWMNAIQNDDWNVELYEKNDNILGIFVYIIKRKFGMKYISMPKLTQTSGIWIKYEENMKQEKKIALENEIMEYFIDKINHMKLTFFLQCFTPLVNNCLPFYWNGFSSQINYTFVLSNNKDEIWNNFSQNMRNKIKKCEKNLEIFECDDPNMFYNLWVKTYERQGQKARIDKEKFISFDNKLHKANKRIMLGARDSEKNIHSICYFIKDKNKMYYLLGGNDPEYRKSNANSLIMWEGIKIACLSNLIFDFEGSMNKKINLFMRQFGGSLVPYYEVFKVYTKNPLLKFLINKKFRG